VRIVGWIVCIFVGLLVVGGLLGTRDPQATAQGSRPTTLADLTQGAYIKKWTVGFDEHFIWFVPRVTIATGEHAVRDPIMVCEYRGGSGTIVSRETKVIYEKVPAHGERTFRPRLFMPPIGLKANCYLIGAQRDLTPAPAKKAPAKREGKR
jgi:hypothetical protein